MVFNVFCNTKQQNVQYMFHVCETHKKHPVCLTYVLKHMFYRCFMLNIWLFFSHVQLTICNIMLDAFMSHMCITHKMYVQFHVVKYNLPIYMFYTLR